jgi:hypothetical protein
MCEHRLIRHALSLKSTGRHAERGSRNTTWTTQQLAMCEATAAATWSL